MTDQDEVSATCATDDVGLVSAFWGDERKDLRKHNWLEHPVSRGVINSRVSGDPQVDACGYWRRNFLQEPLASVLSLGCGFGSFERDALRSGLTIRIDAFDVSDAAIAQARAYAEAAGVQDRVAYSVADINSLDLPTQHYEAVFGISSIHHVFDLESVFQNCRKALKSGGLLFLDEYIGPSRFQLTSSNVELINRLLRALPERYRRNVFTNGDVTNTYANPSIEWFENNDPSEAVRSAEIMATLQYYFDIVDYRPYGGAVLHMLLSGMAGNYDPEIDADVALLRSFAILEESLENAAVLTSHFAAIVARPKL
jgi:SAM-dependent methyltransferase